MGEIESPELIEGLVPVIRLAGGLIFPEIVFFVGLAPLVVDLEEIS